MIRTLRFVALGACAFGIGMIIATMAFVVWVAHHSKPARAR